MSNGNNPPIGSKYILEGRLVTMGPQGVIPDGALYIEDGEIKGRVREGMVAGNIYDIMKKVASIENGVHWTHDGRFPAVCFDDIKFSAK